MSEQARKRQLQHTLSIAGSGVFAFCVWSLAKVSLFLTLVDQDTLQDVLRSLLGLGDAELTAAVYGSLIAMIIIDLVLRAYVGLSARAEGRGKKKGPLYLVVAVIVAVANVSSLVAIALGTSLASSVLNTVISTAVEATAIATLVLVVYSSMALRRMEKVEG